MALIVVAVIVTATLLCGANVVAVAPVAILDGGKAALWVGGAAAVGDALLRLARVRSAGPLRVATAGGLGLGIFSLAGLGLGLLGLLNRPVALALPGLGYLLAALRLARQGTAGWNRESLVGWLARPAVGLWLWAVPAVSLAVACVAAGLLPGALWKPLDPHPYDVTSYHLQVPREWYEAGRVVPLAHNMFSYFPMNVEVQYLLLDHAVGGGAFRGPWKAMYTCQYLSVGYTLLMLLAVAGAADRSRASGAVAAAVASAVPWVIMLAGVAYVEAALMLYTALAVAWAMRAVAPPEPSGSAAGSFVRHMLVAGVMAGFACGVKITAVPMLLMAVPLAAALAAWKAIPWRTVAIGGAVAVVAGGLLVSPWLVRNLAWAHNPLWPVGMSALGRDHFSPGQVERFITAHSPRPDQRSIAGRSAVLWNDVLAHWQYGYVLLPAALVALGLRWRDRQTLVLLVVGATVFVIWFGFTHLLARFLVMLVPIAAIAVGRATAGRAWPAGVAFAVAGAITGWAGVWGPLVNWSGKPENGGLFGLDDFTGIVLNEPRLSTALATDGEHIGLVGDAQAFFFQCPMTRLRYRTVFDLPADQPDPVAAWVGPEARGNGAWLLVINPAEVARLHDTYRHTPTIPPQWVARGPETFLQRGDELKP